MTILSGKSYYQIDKNDEEGGFIIDPLLPNGTLIKRIQVNFGFEASGANITLPNLSGLNGQCLFEIVLTSSTTDRRVLPINVISYNTVNDSIARDSIIVTVPFGSSAIFNGVSPTNYVATGAYFVDGNVLDPIRPI